MRTKTKNPEPQPQFVSYGRARAQYAPTFLGFDKTKGRGVYAAKFIPVGTLIECCETILFPRNRNLRTLERYGFLTPSNEGMLIALGNGSLYNHSPKPNAGYNHTPHLTISFTALRDIPAGQEITTNYNGDPFDQTPVSFT